MPPKAQVRHGLINLDPAWALTSAPGTSGLVLAPVPVLVLGCIYQPTLLAMLATGTRCMHCKPRTTAQNQGHGRASFIVFADLANLRINARLSGNAAFATKKQ